MHSWCIRPPRVRRASRFLHGLLTREISAGTTRLPPSLRTQKIDLWLISFIYIVESKFCQILRVENDMQLHLWLLLLWEWYGRSIKQHLTRPRRLIRFILVLIIKYFFNRLLYRRYKRELFLWRVFTFSCFKYYFAINEMISIAVLRFKL